MKRRYIILEIVYTIPALIFQFVLKKFNSVLLAESFDSSLALLMYDNYKALKFFAGALGFMMAGVILIFYFCRQITRIEELGYPLILLPIFSIVVNIFVIILTFIFIDNPILRAVMGVAATATAILLLGKNT